MTVELAHAADLAAVMNVLDGADLEIAAVDVETAIDRKRVLLARSVEGTVLGATVGWPRDRDVRAERPRDRNGRVGQTTDREVRIEAIAVRPGRRGQRIGTRLVEAAFDRWGPLTAEFDPGLATFYRTVGFDIDCGERCFGRRE